MKRICTAVLCFFFMVSLSFGQRETMVLTFTAVNNADRVQLDYVKVMNRTQGGDTVLLYPDTVLVLNYTVNVPENISGKTTFGILKCYPNPTLDKNTIIIYVPKKDRVSMMVSDFMGKVIIQSERTLDQGLSSFRFTTGQGNQYIITAQWRGQSTMVKVFGTASSTQGSCKLEFMGSEKLIPQIKLMEEVNSFPFSLGDELLYIGHFNAMQSGIPDTPDTSKTYAFQFATNMPCPGTPTVDYEGQVYNTIQILSQCWLKENLNAGTMIDGSMDMTDNGIIEKYCYYNLPDSCTKYGGLYQWQELMQYTTHEGMQGLCPPGWHVPSGADWKVLEGGIDSHYGIGDPEWDIYGEERGYDAGTNLKTTSGWYEDGNGTDLYGFSAIPSGFRDPLWKDFYLSNRYADWWTSSKNTDSENWDVYIAHNWNGIGRTDYTDQWGFHVRCLKDQ